MSTTTAIRRSTNLRRLNFLHHRFSTSSPPQQPPLLLPHSLSPLFRPSLPFLNSVDLRIQEVKSFGLYSRYLSSSAAPPPSESKSSSGSGDGDNSQQSGDSGKSIRGSSVSWMSLFLLFVTGAGLVFYYNKEKKRHIEGRLLW